MSLRCNVEKSKGSLYGRRRRRSSILTARHRLPPAPSLPPALQRRLTPPHIRRQPSRAPLRPLPAPPQHPHGPPPAPSLLPALQRRLTPPHVRRQTSSAPLRPLPASPQHPHGPSTAPLPPSQQPALQRRRNLRPAIAAAAHAAPMGAPAWLPPDAYAHPHVSWLIMPLLFDAVATPAAQLPAQWAFPRPQGFATLARRLRMALAPGETYPPTLHMGRLLPHGGGVARAALTRDGEPGGAPHRSLCRRLATWRSHSCRGGRRHAAGCSSAEHGSVDAAGTTDVDVSQPTSATPPLRPPPPPLAPPQQTPPSRPPPAAPAAAAMSAAWVYSFTKACWRNAVARFGCAAPKPAPTADSSPPTSTGLAIGS